MSSESWTSAPPSVPGAYWWRLKDGVSSKIVIVHYDGTIDARDYKASGIGGEWLAVPSPERLLKLLRIEEAFHERGDNA